MKGAPERILARCSKIMINGEEVEMTDEYRKKYDVAYEHLGGLGERVLGFGHMWIDESEFPFQGTLFSFVGDYSSSGLFKVGLEKSDLDIS